MVDNASPVVLRALGLRKSFGGQSVLGGVDVELRRGEVVLLDGENGSGKTTLLNILTGNLEADAGTICYSANSHATEYHFPRSWLQKLSLFNGFSPEAVARKGFGRTWQDVRLFESLSLRDNIALGQPSQRGENPFFALFGYGNGSISSEALATGKNTTDLAAGRKPSNEHHQPTTNSLPNAASLNDSSPPHEMLAHLGLAGREQSSGNMISLGQSKRVAIARAIAAGAKVLFLDEPLAGLDRNGIDEVLGMLSKLVAEHDVTIVIIEHAFNQAYLRDLITTRWHLADGKITTGIPQQPIANKTAEQPHWFQQLAAAADEIITEPLPRGAALNRFRINDRYKPNPVLEIKDLIVKRGKRMVIGIDDEGNEPGFNVTIHEGEIAVLQAPNGWGKSTLFDAIIGSICVEASFARILKTELGQHPVWERCQKYLVAVTSGASVFSSLTVGDNVHLATGEPLVRRPELCRYASELSGGQLRKLALRIAISKARKHRLLLLDEPFLGLDSRTSSSVLEQIVSATFNACLILVPR